MSNIINRGEDEDEDTVSKIPLMKSMNKRFYQNIIIPRVDHLKMIEIDGLACDLFHKPIDGATHPIVLLGCALRTNLDVGKHLGLLDGVLINGKGPYRYNRTLVPDGIDFETINVDPGFANQSLWQSVTGVAVLHYSNSEGKAAGSLPDPPNNVYDTSFLLNQTMSISQQFLIFICHEHHDGSRSELDFLSPFIIKKLYFGSLKQIESVNGGHRNGAVAGTLLIK
ncbi:unnamed protein product [Camellia sinensis]